METRAAAASFLEYCRLRGLSPSTLAFYRWGLKALAEHCSELPEDHWKAMRPLGNPRLSQESKHDLDRVLRTFFRWVSAEYHLTNPMLRVDRLPRPRSLRRALSRAEIEAVWSACDNERDQGLIALVLDTGLRLSEIAGMWKRDLSLHRLRVKGKVGQRQVPVSPQLSARLFALGDEVSFWLGPAGARLTRSGVQQVFRRVLKRAGLTGPKLTGPHCLRHTFGTEYVRCGGNP